MKEGDAFPLRGCEERYVRLSSLTPDAPCQARKPDVPNSSSRFFHSLSDPFIRVLRVIRGSLRFRTNRVVDPIVGESQSALVFDAKFYYSPQPRSPAEGDSRFGARSNALRSSTPGRCSQPRRHVRNRPDPVSDVGVNRGLFCIRVAGGQLPGSSRDRLGVQSMNGVRKPRAARIGYSRRAWYRHTGQIAALVLVLSVVALTSAQSGTAVPPYPARLPDIGGSSGQPETPRPVTGPKASEAQETEADAPLPASVTRFEAEEDDQGVYDPKLLLSLLQEEVVLLQNFGPEYPQLQSVQERIRLVRKHLATKSSPYAMASKQGRLPAAQTSTVLGTGGITLAGGSSRQLHGPDDGSLEPRLLNPTVLGTTEKAAVAPPPVTVSLSQGGPASSEHYADLRATSPFQSALQWIGLTAVSLLGLATMIVIIYLLRRSLGSGVPLIQVHLVNTQSGGNEIPGDHRSPVLVAPQTRDPLPTVVEPTGSAANSLPMPNAAAPDDALDGQEDTIIKQVIAMNMQLKADLVKMGEEAGGEPELFGPDPHNVTESESPAKIEN